MIGSLLDALFSGQNIKRLASVCFCLPIIAAIVIGIKAKEGFLFILLCILIGFVAGVILSFTWHVLGQILDFLEKIRNNLKVLNDKFPRDNVTTLFESINGTRKDIREINSKVK